MFKSVFLEKSQKESAKHKAIGLALHYKRPRGGKALDLSSQFEINLPEEVNENLGTPVDVDDPFHLMQRVDEYCEVEGLSHLCLILIYIYCS